MNDSLKNELRGSIPIKVNRFDTERGFYKIIILYNNSSGCFYFLKLKDDKVVELVNLSKSAKFIDSLSK